MMIRILVTDGMDAEALEQLKLRGFEVSCRHYEAEDLAQAMAQFDAVVVRSSTRIGAGQLQACKNSRLKLIVRGGVGLDNIDTACAHDCGIAVRNTPKASSRSVAELALAHLLSCCRFISVAGHTMREDKWEKKTYAHGLELQEKTLGIIGFGRIGRCLGQMAKALGMTVLAYDLYPVKGLEEQTGIPYVSLEELLSRADFLSVHAPAADGNPIICAQTIGQMKDGVIIVNTSRGKNVDEQALLEGLESGKIRAAGLDVYLQEPTPNHALYSHPRVSCTPHIGAQTDEAQARVGAEVVEVLQSFFEME